MRPLNKKSEIKRLHKLGFGIHYLNPKQKNPVKKWNTNTRDSLETLLKEYKESYNIGTRLSSASKIEEGYAAILDIDIRSGDKAHKDQAINWVKRNFPGLYETAPITMSGRSNGSMHIWMRVKEPLSKRRLYASPDEVVTHMPSAKATDRQKEILTKKQIDDGLRVRSAFEIDFMCDGNQVVLPPSTHPDTGKPYKWFREITDVASIPLVDMESLMAAIPENKNARAGRPRGSVEKVHEIVDVEESELETRLTPKLSGAIFSGDDVNDRSAMMLTISLSMIRAGFTDAEILGVLTNREYFIGECAYDHAQTNSRQRAARWAYDYSLAKAHAEIESNSAFSGDVVVYDTLNAEESEAQLNELIEPLEERDWKSFLDKTKNEDLKPSYNNTVLILEYGISKSVFMRDSFALRDVYGCDTPWGKKRGEELGNDDTSLILFWLSTVWKIEPNDGHIRKAVTKICCNNIYHPVKEYLTSIEWDGVPRIDTWLKDYIGAEGPELYLKEVSRKFLVAAVARIFEPGRKYETMLILEGKQGIGKSSVGSILAGDKWFLDSLPNLADKDASLNLQGNWIVEMGELANLRRADIDVAKDFIARRIDKVRPPYGERSVTVPRQSVFFGTTNNDDYLKDKTGNRRYWPVKVHELDFIGLKRDRDQLWAEALFVYDMYNENIYLEGESKIIAEGVQESRVGEDESSVMHDMLMSWYEQIKKLDNKKPLKISLLSLFGDSSFENVRPPFVGFDTTDNKIKTAASGLRKLGFTRVKISGRWIWREGKNIPPQKPDF